MLHLINVRRLLSLAPVLALVGVMAVSVSGCETFAGFGQDVQTGGEAVEGTARDVERQM